ncbi:MAG: rod shape-determining protein MreC [Alphaproteobacteria bacterium]|nr:rod shape-determining protein MreC [Alphaproteobacteria bacterium]
MRRSNGRAARNSNPERNMAQRASFAVFVAVSLGLLLVTKLYPTLTEQVQGVLIDVAAPVVDVLGEPVLAFRSFGGRVADTLDGADRVEALRAQNERLKRWRDVALRLDSENAQLRSLMRLSDETKIPAVTTRVISDPGGPFVRAIILDSGGAKGISKFQPVMDPAGVVGRIVTVGRHSARALLLTDLNSRVPVFIRRTGDRAILVGDNSDRPRLAYLPMESSVKVGDEVLTSGDGGVFPAKLPVGVVDYVRGSTVRVRLAADLARLDFVNVLAYEPVERPEAAPGIADIPAPPADGTAAQVAERGPQVRVAPPVAPPVLPSPSPLPPQRAAPTPVPDATPAPEAAGAGEGGT